MPNVNENSNAVQNTCINNTDPQKVGNFAAKDFTAEKTANKAKNSFSVYSLLTKWKELPFKVRLPVLCVFIPTLLCFLYFALWASPMYIAQTKFAIKNASGTPSGLDFASQIFKVPSASTQDAMVIEEYLRSPDVFLTIDKTLAVKRHYSSSDNDLISRLAADATLDDITKFWKKVSTVKVNQDSGVVSFEVRAYNPQMALDIAQEVLKESEKLVNSMNERAKEDALSLAQNEVSEAEQRIYRVQDELKKFRALHQDIDLKATAEGLQGLILELESQAAEVRAQISSTSLYMRKDAPALKALYSKLEGLESQILEQKEKITDLSGANSLNSSVSQYENLMTEADFARQQLMFAMTSFENAKMEIMAKSLYIVTVAKPMEPDESLYPKPVIFSLYVLAAVAMIYLIFSVIVAAIREHAGF